jgi:phosphopantothenoylcysteine decarboxylase/phosphopantothenate--cysteine ligase
MLKGKNILLGITASIAAYKSAILVRLLKKAGADVKVIMTPSTRDFISPLTLSTLSKNPVQIDLFENDTWANHVMLGRWADIMLIAPLSCNSLSKMANGICDNMLLAVYLSATCPVVIAPAMDEDMWCHPSTQNNLNKIHSYGNYIIPVDNGELASGLIGPGRMAEPENILNWLDQYFNKDQHLKGKKVLITAGPTQESIDPVRFISNHSSGKMGIALAEECFRRGADVTIVCGPVTNVIDSKIKTIKIKSAAEMLKHCVEEFKNTDIAILSAAVADYTIDSPSEKKIKKSEDEIVLKLSKTKDILKTLGEMKRSNQILVGFALETDHEKENALLKLKSKNADFIVLNSLNDDGVGFGFDTNKITIFDKSGKEFPFNTKSKKDVAVDIVNTIIA